MFGGQNSTDGVSKKLVSQVSELNRQGVDIGLVLVSIGDVHYPSYDFLTTYRVDIVSMGDFFGRIKRARKISKIFGETIDSLGPDDILYYRYSDAFPLYYPNKYLSPFRSCRIVTEHQTKELDEFKLNNNALAYWSERLCGKLLRKQSDAIIGVTDEITQYEITRAGDLKKTSPYDRKRLCGSIRPLKAGSALQQRSSSPLRRQCQPLARARPAYQGYQHA